MCMMSKHKVSVPPPSPPIILPEVEVAPEDTPAQKKKKARLGKRQLRSDLGGKTGRGTGLGIPKKSE